MRNKLRKIKRVIRETNEAKKLKYQQIIEQIDNWLVDSQLMQKCFDKVEQLKNSGMLYKLDSNDIAPYLITKLNGDVLQNYADQPIILCDDRSDEISIIFGNGDEFIQITPDGLLNEVGEPLEPEEIGREKFHLLISAQAHCKMMAQDFISWFDVISDDVSIVGESNQNITMSFIKFRKLWHTLNKK